jgi:hypothetical protein
MAAMDLDKSRGRLVRDEVPSAALSAALLQAWEDGEDASPGERGLVLLAVAAPSLADDERGRLTVGGRDALLLDFFEQLFGDVATALAQCPGCSAELEFEVPLDEIRVPPPSDRPDRFKLLWSGREIIYRLPQVRDLAALGAEPEGDTVAAAARGLAQRCIMAIDDAEGTLLPPSLGDEAARALEAAIAASVADADPQAVVTLGFDCPSCARNWQSPFDIVEFLWRRLDATARDLLREVHVLASHYGWGEREIVALPPRRRRHYLELIGA